MGATRRQVLRAIVVEALVIGTAASVVGLFLGLGLAKGLFRLFDAVGFTLPNSGIIFATRTAIVSMLVGVDRDADREPAAGRSRHARAADRRRSRGIDPAAVAVRALPHRRLGDRHGGRFRGASLRAVRQAPRTKGVLISMGVGALLIFVGVSMLSVRFIRPLAWGLGWPATKLGGTAGWLARDNARRNPQRTASTAAALMIGLALVTLVALLAAGITASFEGAVNKIWTNADYAITAQNNFDPIPIAAANAVAKAPGVEAVGERAHRRRARVRQELLRDGGQPAGRVDVPARVEGRLAGGVLAARRRRGFIDDGYAKRHQLHLGSPIDMTFSSGAHKTFFVRGIFNPPTGGSPFGTVTISQSAWDKLNAEPGEPLLVRPHAAAATRRRTPPPSTAL